MPMQANEHHDSSRWTGESVPTDVLLVAMILAAGALGFLIIGLLEL
ncbi:MAG: hypothetical protein AB7S41_19825 [Parvibaculaceae bacterium]